MLPHPYIPCYSRSRRHLLINYSIMIAQRCTSKKKKLSKSNQDFRGGICNDDIYNPELKKSCLFPELCKGAGPWDILFHCLVTLHIFSEWILFGRECNVKTNNDNSSTKPISSGAPQRKLE